MILLSSAPSRRHPQTEAWPVPPRYSASRLRQQAPFEHAVRKLDTAGDR